MRVTEKCVYFWGDFPSNWYPARFTVDRDGKELEFFNSEQYFMYEKAVVFGDEETAMKILFEGKDPKRAKTLGRQVKNYDRQGVGTGALPDYGVRQYAQVSPEQRPQGYAPQQGVRW